MKLISGSVNINEKKYTLKSDDVLNINNSFALIWDSFFFSLSLFLIFDHSDQLTYGNAYEFVRKRIAELNLLITITCVVFGNMKRNSDLFFYENFSFFCSSKDVRLSLPKKKEVKEKSFINTKVIVSLLMRIQFFLLSLCQFIFFFISVQTHSVASFRSLFLLFFSHFHWFF